MRFWMGLVLGVLSGAGISAWATVACRPCRRRSVQHRRLALRWSLALAACLAACTPRPRVTPPKPLAPLVQAPETPQVFAPGVISTTAPEFAITFSPDGRTAYFNRASEDRQQLGIYTSQFIDGAWSPPVVAPFAGPHRDVDPFMAPDGRRLYFSSTRPLVAGGAAGEFDTWYVERSGTGWGTPVHAGPVLNSAPNDVFVSIDREGTLFFSSSRDGTLRIYASRPTAAGWTPPEKVPFEPNLSEGASNPLISDDGRFLVYAATRPDGLGGTDLYVTCRQGEGWSRGQNLGPDINSPLADFAPALSPDGQTFFFTSERPGMAPARQDGTRPPGDIYFVSARRVRQHCAR
jgi:Tol biopolymer transport system component